MMATDQSAMPASKEQVIMNAADALDAKAHAMTPPSDFKNTDEYARREREGLGRLITDKYVDALQDGKPFSLSSALSSVGKDQTPDNLASRAATMENRTLGLAQNPHEKDRLTSASMQRVDVLSRGADELGRIANGRDLTVDDFTAQSTVLKNNNLSTHDLANVAHFQNIHIPLRVVQGLKGVDMRDVDASKLQSPSHAGLAQSKDAAISPPK